MADLDDLVCINTILIVLICLMTLIALNQQDLSAKKKKSSKKVTDFEEKDAVVDESSELDFMDLKKKKKKKKVFNPDEFDAADEGKDGKEDAAEEKEETAVLDEDLDFSLTKKKKKKKKAVAFDEETVPEEGLEEDNDPDSEPLSGRQDGSFAWANSDRDYTYDELLSLVFSIIREKNPDLAGGEKKKFVMRPPQVLRVGTKKTSFANFLEICKLLHRPQKHMQAFLLSELGTSGSVDANNQLIIKGRFVQKQIESVLRRYIKEYVACQTCRSPDTILQKDTRLFFLQCETCGSRRSVASIKSGFQAVTGRRAAMRAKGAE